MPSPLSFSAASKQCPTILEKATIVTSFPALSIFAFPIGIVKSGDCAYIDTTKNRKGKKRISATA